MPDADSRIGGRYRLVRQLATGGMGTVWEGWDERLQRPIAIKRLQLQPGLSRRDAEVASQRVMREARLTARLHHPNAVQVFDVVDDDNHPCLIMQYVPSRSLHDIVRDSGPLAPPEVARIGTQVAAALAAAHRAGIVHRDVKPGNVLIAEDGTAKITDFGISHAFDDASLTSTGMVTGTPAYLAPEVARGAASDFASDVYSLGSTLYMAVEGRPPFGTDPNPMAVLHRVASGRPQPPTRSGALAPMLHAMMSPDPAGRPSMVDIANALPDLHPITPEPSAVSASSTTAVLG
ncbi:MAG: serine/threonine-protein kinase, partial [Jatrophihabitantaceae bacterium]